MDRITRTCSIALLLGILAAVPAAAKNAEANPETDLFWEAQRADLLGQSDVALKSYNQLLGKLPGSAVAVDRLFSLAVAHGDFFSTLKAARAQQLANSGDGALPLVFFVDAWKRRDWNGARQSVVWLKEKEIFAFLTPILDAWIDVAQGKRGTITNAALRDSGLLYYYSYDQLIFLDFANGNLESAQRRLSGFPGFGDDYARHMAMTSAEHLGRNGESDYANSLLAYLGVDPVPFEKKPTAFPADQAFAALFSRLSNQLNEQNITEQALFFSRLAHWVSADSAFGRMTLADRLAKQGSDKAALSLLDGIAPIRPQWNWALGEKAKLYNAAGKNAQALRLIQQAQVGRPISQNLTLLEARQLELNGKHDQAIGLYQKLVQTADAAPEKNGRRVAYRLFLAQALDAKDKWLESKATLEEAVLLNSENPEVLNMLGYALLEQRENVKRGLDLVAKAHRLAPQSSAITDSLGWGHYLNGDFEKAVPLLEKAVEGAMNDVTINEHLGDAYWQTGRAIEARYAWRSALLQAEADVAKRIAEKIDLGWTEATAAP